MSFAMELEVVRLRLRLLGKPDGPVGLYLTSFVELLFFSFLGS